MRAVTINFVETPISRFFFHSSHCENIASLVVAKGVAKEKNDLDNGQTNNIFTRVTMEKMYKI